MKNNIRLTGKAGRLERGAVLLLLLIGITTVARAAPPVIWDGGGSDNLWSTPENWTGNQEPTVFDDVILDGTSVKNCTVNLNETMLSFTMRAAYTGTLSFAAGDFTVNGPTVLEGGTIQWSSSPRYFRGDFTRTGGSMSGGSFYFDGSGTQNYRPGVTPTTYSLYVTGGAGQQFNLLGDVAINQGGYSVGISNGSTANLYGSITLGQSDPFYVSGNGTTVNLQSGCTVAMAISGSFNLSSAGATVNVLAGAVLDARQAIEYENRGRVVESGSGRVRRYSTGVGFTDAAGVQVATAPAGSDLFVTLFDDDENVDGGVRDSTRVLVRSLTTGDEETLTLSETDVRTAVFRNTVGLRTGAGAAVRGDGILQQSGSENLEAFYQDNEDAGDQLSGLLIRDPIPWDGGGADNLWTTAENWVGDRVPTVFDSVIFNNTSNKNCTVAQNQEMFNFTMTAGYGGTLSFSAGDFRVNGDLNVSGGTINWSSSPRYFRRDFTRTAGTMSGGSFYFDGSGTQNYRPGPSLTTYSLYVVGGTTQVFHLRGDVSINQGGYSVGISNGGTANFYGLVALGQSDPLYISGSGTTVNLQSGANIVFDTSGSFNLSSAGTRLNVLNGGILDARKATEYENRGQVVETGSGRVLKGATGVGFTDAAGARVSAIPAGISFYVTLFDEDENVDGNLRDPSTVVVESLTTGDRETVTLTETDVRGEVFRNTAAFRTAAGAAAIGDGILQQNGSENLRVTYTDGEDPSDSIIALLDRPPVIWDGGGADQQWITPANWNTDRVPMVYDNVVFNATSAKNCQVTQNAEMFDFTMTSEYRGTLSFSAGDFTVNGNLQVDGGAINWSSSPRYFRGNWTRTAGTMSGGSFYFVGTGTQNYTPGPSLTTYSLYASGGPTQVLNLLGNVTINQGGYSVGISNGGTVNLFGLIVLGQSDPFYVSGSGTTVNLQRDCRVTFGLSGSFNVSSAGAVVNVMDGAVLDALLTTEYENRGLVREMGSGVILRHATGVGFTTAAGVLVPNIPAGTDIYISMLDEDENLDGNARDASSVVLTDLTTGDVETISLRETDVRSEQFRNATGFPSVCGFARSGNGIFEGQDGDSLEIRYVDGEDANDVLVFFTTFVGGCTDCNSNGVDDAQDIAGGSSRDCNTNRLPDECDIARGTSRDSNANGVPDECDPACVPPSISVQPASGTVCAGSMVELTVTAVGSAPLAYQWRKNGVGLPGATSASLAFAPVQLGDAGTYDVQIGNACGAAVSDAATLIAWPAGTGDVNGDGRVNGLDVAPFVAEILASQPGLPSLAMCAADVNGNGMLTAADVAGFVGLLLIP